MSNGQQEGLSGGEEGVKSGNVFDLLGRNMKQLWSGQKWYSLSLMYVRDGANLYVYATIPEVLDRYYYLGTTNAMPEGVMQFASWNSARGANGIFKLTMKDFYYSEDFSDITPNLATVENATISTDKATYANAEKATITVKAAEGYLVTAVTVNGQKKAVEATGEYVLEYLALNPLGINVTAVETVAQSALVAVSGNVAIPEQYAEYYDVTGTVTYENENAVYVGEITDGKYTVNVAPGKYNVTVETKEFIAQDTAEVTAAAEVMLSPPPTKASSRRWWAWASTTLTANLPTPPTAIPTTCRWATSLSFPTSRWSNSVTGLPATCRARSIRSTASWSNRRMPKEWRVLSTPSARATR